MKTFAPYLFVAILSAALCFLLMRGCNKITPLQQSKTAVDSVALARKAGFDSAQKIDGPALLVLIGQRDSLLDTANARQARELIMRYTLDSLGDIVGNTLAATDEARIKHDTIKIVQNCDSLEAEVKAGMPAVTGYTKLTDSLVEAYVARGVVQDSIIAKLTRDGVLAKQTITAQQLQYEVVNADDRSKTAQLKIYKPAAIGGVAILVAVVTLKILLK